MKSGAFRSQNIASFFTKVVLLVVLFQALLFGFLFYFWMFPSYTERSLEALEENVRLLSERLERYISEGVRVLAGESSKFPEPLQVVFVEAELDHWKG